jgi:tetratricopeptide (TPR) repeat protein
METVVEENPLSFATSRIVTIRLFILKGAEIENGVRSAAQGSLNSLGCWRTLHQRVKPVSSLRFQLLVIFPLLSVLSGQVRAEWNLQSGAPKSTADGGGAATRSADPERFFHAGEAALKSGKLDEAERAFQEVVALDPGVAGAYANLGVIHMRRKQWTLALADLRKADKLAPQLPGIRLNIGLVYYRQNDFEHAIPPLESVVRDVPSSFQARYLLGLCYFFRERYAEAESTLEPLWTQASSQLNYLYVLGIAAGKSGNKELEQKALGRLVESGENSAEFHLLMGKAHLNREEYDEAITELQLAAKSDPRLPFVHFDLGVAYLKKQDLDNAKAELIKDIAVEPDLAYDYDQLGNVYYLQQQDQEAEKAFIKALKLDPKLASSHFQLARVYQRESQFTPALVELDAAVKLSPDSESVHYVRGQVLQKLGRIQEAKAEMRTFTTMSNAAREKRHQQLESPMPNPELTQEP